MPTPTTCRTDGVMLVYTTSRGLTVRMLALAGGQPGSVNGPAADGVPRVEVEQSVG